MSVRKICNSWWVDFRFNGARYRKRSPANSKEGAKDYESLLRQKIIRGESLDKEEDKGDTSYHDFIKEWFEIYVKCNNKYSEIISKEKNLRVHLLPFFGKLKLSKIDVMKVEEYKRNKIKSGLSNKTINNHLAVLNKSLDSACEWKFIKERPQIKQLKLKPQSHDYLSEKDCDLLLNETTGIVKEMILVGLRAGLRFGEIIALDWKDIDFERRMISVSKSFFRGVLGTPKSNRTRYIPLAGELFEIFYTRRKASGLLFADKEGGPMKHIRCSKLLYSACRRANLRMISWHILRHTFASHLVQKNISLKAIQELLGHSDIRTTMRYAHLSPTELRSAIDCLESKRNFGQDLGKMPDSSLKFPAFRESKND